MKSTTLCYVETDNSYLMLHRIKKKNDLNEGKWIGIGGHVEPGETPKECILREAYEEAGIRLCGLRFRGVVEFISARWEDEHMYLYTADGYEGTITECSEGVLSWVPKDSIFDLNLWEGDRVFLEYLLEDIPFFHLEVRYDENDELIGTRMLPNLILASASPRRCELLNQIGLSPIVLPSGEAEPQDLDDPAKTVEHLSFLKAQSVAAEFSHGEIILGADTVVVADGMILGKPSDHREAEDMIRRLSGRTHTVLTGVTLIKTGDQPEIRTFHESTDVHVSPMREEEILLYAGSEEPMDKAGAYGIQGHFAAFIRGIDGDYNNVVGLPVGRVYREIRDWL